MSRQLLIGLAVGALCTGLGVMLFNSANIPVPAVSDSGDLQLLAQVIPYEAGEIIKEQTEAAEPEVIEVRAAPATQQKKTVTEPASSVESEGETEELAPEPEITVCVFETKDKPAHNGVINEVAWMGTGDDPNAEWVEIQNRTKTDLDVSGWQLVDEAEQIRAIVPAGVILSKSGFLLFERDEHQLPGTTVRYKGALGNTDEGLRLFDADCGLQDEVIAKSKWPAGTNSPKHTAERAKDLGWHTFYGDDEAGIFGTPGKKNSAGPPPEPEPEPEAEPESEPEQPTDEPDELEVPVVTPVAAGQLIISEVMAGTEASVDDEFIELYNTTGGVISIEGFSLKKKASTGTESTFVSPTRFTGVSVAAGGRVVIGREGKFSGTADMTWPTSYSLAAKNNTLALYNMQAQLIDEVTWIEIPTGQSYACTSQGSCIVQETPNPGE